MNNLKDKYPSWKYGTASKFSTREEEGVAIACKWATHSVSTTTMKRLIYCSDPLTRVVVRMSVAVGKDVSSTSTNTNTNEGDTVVDVYATHWSYSKCNQEMNAERTLAFVNASSVGSSAFVLGDFNAYEESPPSLAMMEMIPVRLAGNDSAAYYMRDSWRALHPDVQAFPGYTFSSLKHKKGLHNRCDRIFYAGKATPVGAEVVCENPGRELIPSDHCAYLFTAEIPCPASTITDAIHVAAYLPPLNARTLALCTELIAVLLFAFVVKKKLTRRQKRGLMNHQHNFLQQRSL